jgi:Xaa-Pro aminopeptidase
MPADPHRGPPLPVAVYRRRRRAVLAALRRACHRALPLLVLGRGPEQPSTEPQPTIGRRRQDAWFDWCCGCQEPGAALLLDHRRGATLFLEPGDPKRVIWDGRRLPPGGAARRLFGVEATATAADLRQEVLRAAARARGHLALIGGARITDHQAAMAASWRRRLAGVELADAAPILAPLRAIKDPQEIARHRRAIAITATALRRTLPLIPRLRRESEVAAELVRHFLAPANAAPAFTPIVGAGGRGATLHYPHADRPLAPGRPLLIDAGATCDGYCADVTRTVPQQGRFEDRRFREVYELVLRCNRLARRHARPGITLAELNDLAWAPILAAGFTRHHNLSHFIGLEVHDVGDRSAPLAPGMIISDEPGVYLPDEGFGIRIEDDLLITATGCEVLSGAIPVTITALERAMAG